MTSPHEDAGAYALDALEPLQRAAFERHLLECAACREEVAGHAEVAAALAATVAEAPPPSLRIAVMDRVAVTPQDRSVVSLGTGTAQAERRSIRAGGQRAWLAAAAAVAAIALVGLAGLAGLARRDQPVEVAVDSAVVALLAAPDARVVPLTGNAGRANFVHSPSEGRGVLVAYDLEPLPDDRVYEFWVARGDAVEPAGLLTPAEDGTAVHVAEVVDDGTGVAVTVEPEGGVDQPTGPRVLSGSLEEGVSWTEGTGRGVLGRGAFTTEPGPARR